MLLIKRLVLFAVTAFLLFGCGYTQLAVSKIKAALHPTPENLRTSSPEKCLLVAGKVVGNIGKGVPLAVVAVTYWEKTGSIMSYAFLPATGPYYLFLPEGRYQLLVFADLNGNSVIEKNELIGRLGDSASLEVTKGRAVKGKIKVEDISVDPSGPRTSEVPVSLDIPSGIKDSVLSAYIPSGVITTLDDKRFDEENAFAGLYQPLAYFEKVNGFLYMLEEYDPGKIPIIFVHGVEGTPKDWQTVVESLDRKRFQPWFFYYPSGLRLDSIAEVFYDTFLSNNAVRTDRMVIVAHSQGGLVVREAMNFCDAQVRENVPRLFISFSTPYGGVDVAASAVAHSPVVVPSWLDLASDSAFLNTLYRRKLPQGTEFDLFFAYRNSHFLKFGPNDDGTITLKSQLNPKAQKEAAQIRGFNETHSEILRNSEVIDEFISILAARRY
jgi:pimeloyl-ACP methyl ester carboxylesterase